MRKLLLSVLLCAALVMGLLPAPAFPMELGNTPEWAEEAPASALEEQTFSEKLLSEYGEQKNAPKAANPAVQNDAAEIYVSSTGNDAQNTGTKDLPFATLAKAVDAAADGTTIYVMSDLTMDQCARFYDKSLKITSGEGGPYTITRSADFKQQSDTARSWYNPAMIEVQSSSASSVGLTLSDIVLDDAGMHEGTVFAQAVSGDGNEDNTVYVQDAKVIKYFRFGVTFYNAVGDPISTWRINKIEYCEDTGPIAQGEGMRGNSEYWGKFYDSPIDHPEIVDVEVEYMDGTTWELSDEEISYVQY